MSVVKVSSSPDRYLGEPEKIWRTRKRFWGADSENTRQWAARMPSGEIEWLTVAEKNVLLATFEFEAV